MSRDQVLHEMGLGPVWRRRHAAQIAGVDEPAVPSILEPSSALALPQNARSNWEQLNATVANCQACGLCTERKQAVLGVGDIKADWLFVGEGPGAEEDQRGEPFVGQAGKLLDAMLTSIGLERGNDVYIANAVKCRPPQNRTPDVSEIEACRPYLAQQIDWLEPKLIIALGRPAAQSLLKREVKIASERGKLHDYRGVPVIVTYHPAYLLRNLEDKAKAWEDLCFMRSTMRGLKPSSQ